jgi:uncharacterized protein YndB with AHSA1/START domain
MRWKRSRTKWNSEPTRAREITVSQTIQIAPVRKTIVVKATPERAFEVFTAQMDRWWPKTHSIADSPVVKSMIEPFVGGRWYTVSEDGSQVTIGHVRVWQPGSQFNVSWAITAAWKSESRVELISEVEVRFVAEANGITRVELEHRDFERMGGSDGQTMRDQVDNGWPGLLELFASEVARKA